MSTLVVTLLGTLISTALVLLFFKSFVFSKYGKTRRENKRHKFLFYAWIVALYFIWGGTSGIINEAFMTTFAGLPVNARALQISVFQLLFWPGVVAAVTWLLIRVFAKEK
jgi:hypothetical protein